MEVRHERANRSPDADPRTGSNPRLAPMRQIVFSRTMESSPDEAVELVRGDMVAFSPR